MLDEPDYYAILQIKPTATAVELRLRHRELVRELHPDKHAGDPAYLERLTQINAAFHVLRDELRRSAYDRRCREKAARTAQSRPRPLPSKNGIKTPPPFRPMDPRFGSKATLYATNPAARKTRRRNALVGGILTAVLSVCVFGWFLSSNGQAPDTNTALSNNLNSFSLGDKTDPAAEQAEQYRAIETNYKSKMQSISSEGADTIASSNDDAVALESVGDVKGADVLKQELAYYQSKMTAVNEQINTLDQIRPMPQEQKLEDTIDQSLDDLTSTDQMLTKDAEIMRRNSNLGTTPSYQYSSTPQPDTTSSSGLSSSNDSTTSSTVQ